MCCTLAFAAASMHAVHVIGVDPYVACEGCALCAQAKSIIIITHFCSDVWRL
jgi:hypothetical protein